MLRIKNLQVPASRLAELMRGKQFLPLAQMAGLCGRLAAGTNAGAVADPLHGRAIVGVVGTRGPHTGDNASCATVLLVDLKGGEANVLLMRDALRVSAALRPCAVVAIVDAQALPLLDGRKPAVRVDHAAGVLVLGTSADAAVCSAVSERGVQCSGLVDARSGRMCAQHQRLRQQTAQSRRPEFSGHFGQAHGDTGAGPRRGATLAAAAAAARLMGLEMRDLRDSDESASARADRRRLVDAQRRRQRRALDELDLDVLLQRRFVSVGAKQLVALHGLLPPEPAASEARASRAVPDRVVRELGYDPVTKQRVARQPKPDTGPKLGRGIVDRSGLVPLPLAAGDGATTIATAASTAPAALPGAATAVSAATATTAPATTARRPAAPAPPTRDPHHDDARAPATTTTPATHAAHAAPCIAYRCGVCRRVTGSANLLCRRDHAGAVQRVRITKRLFECGRCHRRLRLLVHLWPTRACRHCGASNWIAAAWSTRAARPTASHVRSRGGDGAAAVAAGDAGREQGR